MMSYFYSEGSADVQIEEALMWGCQLVQIFYAYNIYNANAHVCTVWWPKLMPQEFGLAYILFSTQCQVEIVWCSNKIHIIITWVCICYVVVPIIQNDEIIPTRGLYIYIYALYIDLCETRGKCDWIGFSAADGMLMISFNCLQLVVEYIYNLTKTDTAYIFFSFNWIKYK